PGPPRSRRSPSSSRRRRSRSPPAPVHPGSSQVRQDPTAGLAAGEQTAAQEGTLERVAAVHAPTAAAAGLAARVPAAHGPATGAGASGRGPLDAPAQIGLQAAEGLAQ